MKSTLRKLYYFFPPSWRIALRRIYYLPTDFWEKLAGKRDALTPPRGMIFIGSGDFKKQGERFLKYFIELGGLNPDHKVLDIGSGIGRMAVPLTGYLSQKGSYEGFDIMKTGVNWCRKNISNRFPNFRFTYVELSNSLYSSTGQSANLFRFPYPGHSFDFVFLTSVFTHMMPDDVANYMKEISRVLAPNGKCFATFFIVDETALEYMKSQPESFFPYEYNEHYLHNQQVPEANVGFKQAFIDDILDSNELTLSLFKPGFWSGRPKDISTDFQDILVFEKN